MFHRRAERMRAEEKGQAQLSANGFFVCMVSRVKDYEHSCRWSHFAYSIPLAPALTGSSITQ